MGKAASVSQRQLADSHGMCCPAALNMNAPSLVFLAGMHRQWAEEEQNMRTCHVFIKVNETWHITGESFLIYVVSLLNTSSCQSQTAVQVSSSPSGSCISLGLRNAEKLLVFPPRLRNWLDMTIDVSDSRQLNTGVAVVEKAWVKGKARSARLRQNHTH